MQAAQRRQSILACLQSASLPISAGALATRFSVSRQVIVGDIALLRAAGEEIFATPRGYVIQRSPAGLIRQVACRHGGADMEPELNSFVDNGCTVLDVIVEHPVYGQLTGPLQLSSRYDVQQFLARCTAPLSRLTEGIHLHTLSCPDEAAYRRALEALDAMGFLLKDEENH
ncbi:MAG: transcription repressor NadR [Ruminococcaceae bacterium]|nr:transcription repressor NadR [Oscillospiraceae bacterium]